jgi:tetratricopeptide (TPR) repeat protein
MRSIIALLALVATAAALDLMEFKNGKTVAVEQATRVGMNLHVVYATADDQHISTKIPIDRVLPEFAFYVWWKGLPANDKAAYMELADWARKNRLFDLTLKVYDAVAAFDEETRAALPAVIQTLRGEEAKWLLENAEALFNAGQLRDAKVEVDRLLEGFKDLPESAPALELRKRIGEREKLLAEERRREEQARRLRKQLLEVKTEAARIGQADAYANGANLRYVAVARWRLNWACCLYEGALARLDDLLPYVEDEALRQQIGGYMDRAATRAVAAYQRLGNLRYLCGDFGAALDAAHRILDFDPDNAAASGLRDRILDGSGPIHIARDRGFLTYRRNYGGLGLVGVGRFR